MNGERISAPDHNAPDALSGLSRRLCANALQADGLGPNLPPAPERPPSGPRAEAEADRITARLSAARVAGMPLGERIGRAPERSS